MAHGGQVHNQKLAHGGQIHAQKLSHAERAAQRADKQPKPKKDE